MTDHADRERTNRPARNDPGPDAPAPAAELIASIPDPMATVDREWRLTWVNHAAADALGREPADLLGVTVWEVAPDLVGTEAEAQLRRAMERGTTESFELHWPSLARDFAVRVFPMRAGIAVHAQDATARRQTERALRESEERFRAFTEYSHHVFWITSPDRDRTLFVSRAYEELWGRPLGPVLPTMHELLDAVHPEDRARLGRAVTLDRNEPWENTYRVVHPDGAVRWVRDRGFPVRDAQGRVRRLAGFAEDITQQKETADALLRSERRFRSLMERSSDVVALLDAAATIRYASPSYEHGLGYTSEELTGRDAFALVHPEDLESTRAAFLGLLGRPGDAISLSFRARHRDGAWRTFDVVARNLLEDPAVEGVVLTGRDVTEQHQLQRQLQQAQKMEAVGRLAGGIAHDFNNILTAITSYSELLLADLREADPARRDVEEIRQAADRAAGLTRQLLAFSRQQVLQPRRLDLGAAVTSMEGMLRRVIGEDIALEVHADKGLWPVRADPHQIEQVILNLVVNAADAMPRGGRLRITVENTELHAAFVRAHPGSTAGQHVLLSVADTGIGMDANVRAHLYEPFFTTKEPGRGTGLGLSTVYGIVKQSDGYIDAESEPGAGTTFLIYLPRWSNAEAAPATSARAPQGALQGSETVLLVEDEPAVRAVARRVLSRYGYTVLEAANGVEALALLERRGAEVDLVASDLIMPQLGGRELAERIGALGIAPAMLFLSGYTRDEILRRGAFPPGTSFLEKPFTVQTLVAAVRAALDQHVRRTPGGA